MKTAKILCGLAVIVMFGTHGAATAQRVRFATPVESTTAQYTPNTTTAPAPNTSQQWVGSGTPTTSSAPPLLPSTPATPAYTQPQPNYTQPGAVGGGTAPPYAPQTTPMPPPAITGPTPVPGNAVQPPATTWDPYATPSGTPSALLQNDPYFQSSPDLSMATMQKFIQGVGIDYDWFAGHGDHELGINDMGITVTCAFPLFFNSQTPLLVSPGFFIHCWDGPVSYPQTAPGQPWPADMPPRTFDAYLDSAWNPQVTQWFSGELNFRIGIYSDFKRVTSDSIRYMGKGMAVLNFSPSFRVKAGVWYLDRNRIKILPAGGVCWTPNPDVYFDILFPNPEIGKRISTWGNTEWWVYFRGAYGGGNWTIQRNSGLGIATDGDYDSVDYNDIRMALGLRFETLKKFAGHFEVGFACSRELVYRYDPPPDFYPRNTVYIGAGVSY